MCVVCKLSSVAQGDRMLSDDEYDDLHGLLREAFMAGYILDTLRGEDTSKIYSAVITLAAHHLCEDKEADFSDWLNTGHRELQASLTLLATQPADIAYTHLIEQGWQLDQIMPKDHGPLAKPSPFVNGGEVPEA